MHMKGRLLRLLLVVVLLASLSSLAACQTPGDYGKYEKAVEAARAEVWKGINSGKTSSASLAIMDGGEVVYSESFGMADREKSVPVKPTTAFNVGSCSKTFCATAIMLLVDDGKVKLDAPVVKYLPGFKMADPRYEDITVRMLLDHSSGLPGSSFANNFGYAFNKDVYKDTLASLAGSHLKAAPGETAPYCNDGFTLAEMVVAEVSGRRYMDFLSEQIFKPLSLNRTGPGVGLRENDDIAACYQADSGTKMPAEVLSLPGAGGLSSTAEDLVTFADSFCSDGRHILSDRSIAEMVKAQPSLLAKTSVEETGINPEASWGLGLDMVDARYYKDKGVKVISKGGSTTNFHAMMICAPEKDVSVAVVQAGSGNDTSEVGLTMFDSVLEAKGLLKAEETVGPPSPSQPLPSGYEAFEGYYAEPGGLYGISVDREGNTVTVETLSDGQVVQTDTMTYRDGLLTTQDGEKHALISVRGRSYYLNTAMGDRLYTTSAEKANLAAEPVGLKIDVNGAQWLRRNSKPFEECEGMAGHVVTSRSLDMLPGYVDVYGIKRVESPDFAGMFSNDVRDQTELTLIEKNGETWARVSDMLFSPAETASALGTGEKSVTIAADGHSHWFRAGEGAVVRFTRSKGSRAVVYSADGAPAWDSAVDGGEVYVPAGSFIELAGMPGDTLKVNAKPSG